MTVEDQLRAAGRAVSEQVRDLPRLDLCPAPDARRARARTSRRWPVTGRWLIPLAAATAVVTVAVTLVAVRNPPRATPTASAAPAASSSGGPAATSARSDPEAVPGYFVAISGLTVAGLQLPGQGTQRDSVIVGKTLTGQRLATIPSPAGSIFVGVTAAADDRTFVLDAIPTTTAKSLTPAATRPRTWYLLRITPGGTPAQPLTPLHFPLPSRADVNGIALSPDGTELAVLYQTARNGDAFPYSGPFTLGIYSVATGAALHTWTGTDPHHGSYAYASDGVPDPNANLTWTSDGQRLAFAYTNSKGPSASLYLREVNLADPGRDLFTDSTVVTTIAVSNATGRSKIWCDSLGITGDGRSAICGAELPRTPPVGATLDAVTDPQPQAGCAALTETVNPGLARISLAGDRLAQVLYEVQPKCMGGGYAAVLWSSPSGGTLLGALSYPEGSGSAMTEHYAIVLYRHGTVTTIKWPGAADTLVPNKTAF